MSDLIERQQPIDRINKKLAEVYRYPKTEYAEGYVNACKAARQMISEIPSAQPELIRCKDCKNWDTTWTNDFAPNYHYCPMVDGTRKSDFYCADAERRTDE